jgi:hypothetical protein
VPQPPYSTDLAPCDFFLFGYPKQHLEGKHFTREYDVITAVMDVFDKIPLHTFQNMMADWQYRLRRCVQLGQRGPSLTKKKFQKYPVFGNFVLTARTSARPYINCKVDLQAIL